MMKKDDDDGDLDDAIVILIEGNKIGCLLMTTLIVKLCMRRPESL